MTPRRQRLPIKRRFIVSAAVVVLFGLAGAKTAFFLRQSSLDAALLRAIQQDSVPDVSRLLDAGASANATEIAVVRFPDNWEELRGFGRFVEQQQQERMSGAQVPRTALSIAAGLRYTSESSDAEVCSLLLSHGASPNTHGPYGSTPLHSAAGAGKLEIVRLFLKAGASIDARNTFGKTPLMNACRGRMWGHSSLIDASTPQYTPVLRFLLTHGASLNAVDKNGETALCAACLAGDRETIALLLTQGALTTAAQPGRVSPLHTAALRGDPLIVRALLAQGADPMEKDQDGKTPLDWAWLGSDKTPMEDHTLVRRLLQKARAAKPIE